MTTPRTCGPELLAFAAEKQCEAERLVQHAREGMGGVDGDGGEQRIDLALKVGLGVGAGVFVELLPFEQADALFAEFGEEQFVPAVVLRWTKVWISAVR